MVEGDDLPLDILVLGGFNGIEHKLLVLGSGGVIAVEHQEQDIVVDKVVVASGGGGAGGTLIGHVEVLAVGVGAGVVVADNGCHGQAQQGVVVQIAVVLALAVGGVHLVAGGEQEGHVGENAVGVNDVQGVVPAGGVAGCVAAGADLGVTHIGEGERAGSAGGEGIHIALITVVAELIVIGGVCFQPGGGGLAAVQAVVGDGGSSGDGLRAGQGSVVRHGQGSVFQGRVPGEVHLALVRAHGQADVGLIDHFLVGEGQVGEMEPDIGTVNPALMEFDGDGVLTLVQDAQVNHFKGNCLGCTSIGAAVLDVGGDAAVIKTRDFYAIDVYSGSIVILEGTDQLGYTCQRGDVEGCAEEVGFNVGSAIFFVLGQQSLGRAAAAQIRNRAVLRTEGTCGGLPAVRDERSRRPAGAVVARIFRVTRRVAAVVQIGPLGLAVQQGVGSGQSLGGEGHARHGEVDIRAARCTVVQLHGHHIFAGLQCCKGFAIRDGKGLSYRTGRCNVGAETAVAVAAIIVEAFHLDAIDIENHSVVIGDGARDCGHGRGVSHIDRGAEIVGGDVVGVAGAAVQLYRRAGKSPAVLRAEAAGSSLPLAVVKASGGPAGAVIICIFRISGGIGIVVQIGPYRAGVDLVWSRGCGGLHGKGRGDQAQQKEHHQQQACDSFHSFLVSPFACRWFSCTPECTYSQSKV